MSEQEELQQPIGPTTQDAATETAPDSGENHDNKPLFSEEQQKVVNSIAAKKAFEVKEARREAEELKKQLEDVRSKIPQETRPAIPDVDPYSDSYEDDLRKRDEAIRQAVLYDKQQEYKAEQDSKAKLEAESKKKEEFAKTVNTYNERAVKLGVSEAELQAAGNAVVNYGINEQVASFILNDDQGPLITKYLAQNPLELETLSQLDPMNAAIRIQTEIKQKASTLGVKTPTAPNPVEPLSGSGMPLKEKGPKGATYT